MAAEPFTDPTTSMAQQIAPAVAGLLTLGIGYRLASSFADPHTVKPKLTLPASPSWSTGYSASLSQQLPAGIMMGDTCAETPPNALTDVGGHFRRSRTPEARRSPVSSPTPRLRHQDRNRC
jgi:hypothetical protein